MSFFLILTVALMAGAAVLIAKRRSQRGASRSGRYRSPRAGLNLERPSGLPSRSRREAAPRSSSLAGPIFLSLVVVVMVFWVVAAFLLPEGETRAAMVSEPRADAAAPEQFSSLAGRLSSEPGQAGAGSLMAQAAAGTSAQVVQTGGSLMAAAQSMVPAGDSRLAQVGLIPGRAPAKAPVNSGSSAKKAAPADTPARTPQAAPTQPKRNAPAPANIGPAVSAAPLTPSPPTAAGTAVARSSVASAASASSAPRAAAGGTGPARSAGSGSNLPVLDEAALTSSRAFTVHLASFTIEDNAARYQAKLAEAGEPAFITQATREGRLWFRVMSGRFNTRAAAEAHGKDLKRRSLTVETGRYMIEAVN